MMKISIITQDPELLQILTNNTESGCTVQVGDGVALTYDKTLSLRGFSVAPYTAQMVQFVLEHVDTIATGLLAAWLYDRLKGRRAELHVGDDDYVTISPEAIRLALERRQANKTPEELAAGRRET